MLPHGHVVWRSVSGPSRRRSSCACTPTAPHILLVLAACSPSPGPSTVQLHEAIVSVRLACMPVVRPKRPKSGELPHLSAASNDATNRAAPSTTSHAPIHNPLQSPRSLLYSCLALVARVKERSQIMVLPLPHQMERRKKISLWSSAAQLFFIGSRGRGPSRTTIDSNNSSNNAGGRGVDVEQLQTAHEHPHEFPSRCW